MGWFIIVLPTLHCIMFALTTIGFSPDRYRTKEISAKDGKDFIAVQGKLEFDEASWKLNTVSSCFPQPPWQLWVILFVIYKRGSECWTETGLWKWNRNATLMAFQFSQAVLDTSCNFTFPCDHDQDEDQKLLCIKILDDDEHEPDTYFDVELSDPKTEDSNVGAFFRFECHAQRQRERERSQDWKGMECDTDREWEESTEESEDQTACRGCSHSREEQNSSCAPRKELLMLLHAVAIWVQTHLPRAVLTIQVRIVDDDAVGILAFRSAEEKAICHCQNNNSEVTVSRGSWMRVDGIRWYQMISDGIRWYLCASSNMPAKKCRWQKILPVRRLLALLSCAAFAKLVLGTVWQKWLISFTAGHQHCSA